jgi:hypothetical protein
MITTDGGVLPDEHPSETCQGAPSACHVGAAPPVQSAFTSVDWHAERRAILARLDVASTFQELGMAFFDAEVDEEGWRRCDTSGDGDDVASTGWISVKLGVVESGEPSLKSWIFSPTRSYVAASPVTGRPCVISLPKSASICPRSNSARGDFFARVCTRLAAYQSDPVTADRGLPVVPANVITVNKGVTLARPSRSADPT